MVLGRRSFDQSLARTVMIREYIHDCYHTEVKRGGALGKCFTATVTPHNTKQLSDHVLPALTVRHAPSENAQSIVKLKNQLVAFIFY